MKLYDIISNLKFIGIKNFRDINIDSLSCNSKEKLNNSIFFCINGLNIDGHNYAKEAIENEISSYGISFCNKNLAAIWYFPNSNLVRT